ncbi:MAG: hypothetical protein R3323_02945 [Wenzhouxiangellaceae bacterium]|nr:hypothetical protein [Wenzhouxiangellaceae bacterium]
MTALRAGAPGKLILVGEYAVLEGAPAVVAAVQRRARVTIESGGDGAGLVEAPQVVDEPLRFRVDERGFRFDDAARARGLGMTARLLPALLECCASRTPIRRILVDTAALHAADGVKLGLGSSAAVAAALATAVAALVGREAPTLDALLPTYRAALGGPASGADLAAALRGGWLRVQAGGGNLVADEWEPPPGLRILPVWTGRAADTADHVAAFRAWREGRPEEASDWLARAGSLSAAASGAGEVTGFLEACRAWTAMLDELGAAMDKPVLSDRHRPLLRLAASAGVLYKSCGAGGGDLGVAMSDDAERLSAFRAGVSGLGARPVDLAFAGPGAGVEDGPSPSRRGPREGA